MAGLILMCAVLVVGGPKDWILITPEVPKAKTFIEKTWPHWEKPNVFKSFDTPWKRPPLQVV